MFLETFVRHAIGSQPACKPQASLTFATRPIAATWFYFYTTKRPEEEALSNVTIDCSGANSGLIDRRNAIRTFASAANAFGTLTTVCATVNINFAYPRKREITRARERALEISGYFRSYRQ